MTPDRTDADAPILVIGRTGQLARALAAQNDAVTACGRDQFDLAQHDPAALLDHHRPRIVINAAAYTDVNGAENDEMAARALNCTGPARLAAACKARDVGFLHVSTDYVFDGTPGQAPYAETAATNPLNVYARTKHEGEQAILDANDTALILRAAWIFDARGGSFLNAILNRLDQGQPLKVVDDQISTPSWAPDLAQALLTLAARDERPSGVFHYRGGDYASWYDFAHAAAELARPYLKSDPVITAVDSTAFPQPAKRPKDTRLDAQALLDATGIGAGDWRAGLPEVIAQRYEQRIG
ncbi:MAG: dTDP-4-dehydrorhamnose reductase [Oceanicaulis sp.]|uniref:dTDP-4-dehydrorhamnose reductase n=1 Tax=Oceanicaulis sp. UBA2681 TaxID=1947007 RepID=UPI000C0A8785|nr:dTDP-4-dehydrorhamnose reductase [Oceanicaulis sp. UBA2681]MAP48614.1 dTDP-4-dehydrorhamnose reductase [Oceanicaulis sp.]|tara:strand:+ start:5422 stop:6312 length:891 start_codon:yes stop_codon:yes gene_type:complete